MIYGKLTDFESLLPGRPSGAVVQALAWIRSLPAEPAEGRYELDPATGLYAMVMRYETVAPDASRFETHRRAVDLQYTLAGAEGIEWAHAADLTPAGPFDDEKDLQFYLPGTPRALVENRPGFFSLYTPTDAHRPKIHLPGDHDVFKLVVKIPLAAFGGGVQE
jgi:biofilm protein TabA